MCCPPYPVGVVWAFICISLVFVESLVSAFCWLMNSFATSLFLSYPFPLSVCLSIDTLTHPSSLSLSTVYLFAHSFSPSAPLPFLSPLTVCVPLYAWVILVCPAGVCECWYVIDGLWLNSGSIYKLTLSQHTIIQDQHIVPQATAASRSWQWFSFFFCVCVCVCLSCSSIAYCSIELNPRKICVSKKSVCLCVYVCLCVCVFACLVWNRNYVTQTYTHTQTHTRACTQTYQWHSWCNHECY